MNSTSSQSHRRYGFLLCYLTALFASPPPHVDGFAVSPFGGNGAQSSSSSSTTTTTRLFQEKEENAKSSSSPTTFSASSVRFLGKGSNAIVRPGVVLLAPAEEYHHFLRQSAVFIYDMGENENDSDDDTDSDYVIRGAILDHPTPFTIGEMIATADPNSNQGSGVGVYDNLVFRGGDTGSKDETEAVFCIHGMPGVSRNDEIGTSGIYQGGDLNRMSSHPELVKFFFNYMEFTEDELEQMLEVTHEDGDAWTSVEVPKEVVLSSEYDRGDAWSKLRNAIRGQIKQS